MNTRFLMKNNDFALLPSVHSFGCLGNYHRSCHSERSLRSEDVCPIVRLLCDEALLGFATEKFLAKNQE